MKRNFSSVYLFFLLTIFGCVSISKTQRQKIVSKIENRAKELEKFKKTEINPRGENYYGLSMDLDSMVTLYYYTQTGELLVDTTKHLSYGVVGFNIEDTSRFCVFYDVLEDTIKYREDTEQFLISKAYYLLKLMYDLDVVQVYGVEYSKDDCGHFLRMNTKKKEQLLYFFEARTKECVNLNGYEELSERLYVKKN